MSSTLQRGGGGPSQQTLMQQAGNPHQRPKSSNVNYGLNKSLTHHLGKDETDILSKSIDIKKLKEEHQQAQSVEHPPMKTAQGLSHISSIKQASLLKNTLTISDNGSDRSIDSSILSGQLKPHTFKLNVGSSSTLRSGIAAQMTEHRQISFKPQNVQMANPSSGLQVLHQDLKRVANDTGSYIRGRKLDSPHLVVVKELRYQEDVLDGTNPDSKHNAARAVAKRSHSRENNFINHNKSIDKTKDASKNRQTRSVENQNRRKRSKERIPQCMGVKPPLGNITNEKIQKKKQNQTMIQKLNSKVVATLTTQGLSGAIGPITRKQRSLSKGTKSSRDIKTSIGFSELLNNLDKEIGNQQSAFSREGLDFKNRTTHGIIQSDPLHDIKNTSHSKKSEVLDKSKSRSRERPGNNDTVNLLSQAQRQNIIHSLQVVMPKSILGSSLLNIKNKQQLKKSCNTHNNLTDNTPERTKASFIQGSEHGRCVTSQALNQSTSCNNNAHGLGKMTIESQNNLSTQYSGQHHEHHGNYGRIMKDQSSPDRAATQQQTSKAAGGFDIDSLVKQNIKKNKCKLEEKRIQREASEERLKKKKEVNEHNNNLVRFINKEKTYKRHLLAKNQALGNQQSQDFVQTNDFSCLNPRVINIVRKQDKQQFRNLKIQQLSQSQKLDFQFLNNNTSIAAEHHQKVQHTKQAPHRNGGGHRKSYGLEFIDIKKEIQEELKTIEHHAHNHFDLRKPAADAVNDKQNSSSLDLDMFVNPKIKEQLAVSLHEKHKPRRKVAKVEEEPASMLELNSSDSQNLDGGAGDSQSFRIAAGVSKPERLNIWHVPHLKFDDDSFGKCDDLPEHGKVPNQKILVIRKSKIRKFMKMKKKEKQKETILTQNCEILRTIKMQENMTKLNEFCKRNLHKNIVKKRNATIQHHQNININNVSLKNIQTRGNEGGENDRTTLLVNQSKISARRLVFDKVAKKKRELNNDDSSRLSTDFYEEYYRLLNSLKKGDQTMVHELPHDGMSRAKHAHGPKSPTSKSQLLINQTNAKILLSPKIRKENENIGKSKKSQKTTVMVFSKSSLSHNKKGGLRTKSARKQLKRSINKHRPEGGLNETIIIPEDHTSQLQIQMKPKTKDRAESAPLYKRKHIKLQKEVIPQGVNDEEVLGMTETELELLSIFLNKQATIIQRAYRQHLEIQGFYDISTGTALQVVEGNKPEEGPYLSSHIQSSYNSKDYESKNNNNNNNNIVQYVETDQEEEEEETVRREQSPSQHDQDALTDERFKDQHEEEDAALYGDENDYDEEEEEASSPHHLIIIDQHNDDDKKIVYLSNINSCSLPQTPKIEEQPPTCSNVLEKRANQRAAFNAGGLILESIGKHQSDIKELLSQKSSLVQEESGNNMSRRTKQSLVIDDLQIPATTRMANEQKNDDSKKQTDYQMRLFTGSESFLRELKLSTPRERKNSSIKIMDIQSTGHGAGSKRILTSHNSQSSLIDMTQHIVGAYAGGAREDSLYPMAQEDTQNQNQLQQQAQTHTQTSQSQSSQSLFERNSFQKFTADKLQKIVKDNEFMHLVQVRERALDYRQEKERRYIKKMYKSRQLSPRTYTQKKDQLEKWVSLEQEEILKSKKQFQEEWDKTVHMIEETQKNVELMREQIKNHTDTNMQVHSVRHYQQASGYSSQQNDLQSSRNSNGSYATTSHKLERKSILDQEEYMPLSHRSNRMATLQTQASKAQELKNTLDSSEMNPTQNIPNNGSSLAVEGLNSNLIDFLEDSWKKTQQSSVPTLQLLDTTKLQTSKKVGEGILIEDQNDIQQLDPLLQSNNERAVSSNKDSEEQVSQGDNLDVQEQHSDQVREEERPLTRSRSEKDLTDLIKKTKQQISHYNEDDRQSLGDDNQDSFRVLESDRYDFYGKKAGEIRIQENLFDDSSQRQLSHHDFYQAHHSAGPYDNDLPSQDSLLNEQELNSNFKGGERFSIQDFKNLDKRKLLKDDEIDSDYLIDAALNSQRVDLQNDQSSDHLHQQYSQDRDSQSEDLSLKDAYQVQNQNSSFLFQNARPGENIKIADILRKSQDTTTSKYQQQQQQHHQFSSSIQENSPEQFKISMQEIAQVPVEKSDSKLELANQIADELFDMLMKQEVEMPLLQIQQAKSNSSNSNGNQDVFVIEAGYNEKEQRKELIEFRQRVLIEQDLHRIENYINEIITMLQQHELNYLEALAGTNVVPKLNPDDPNYHRLFLQVLTIPIKRVQLELLNQLQTSEIGSYEHFETTLDISAHPILPVDLYLDIERQREEDHMRGMYSHIPNAGGGIDLENSVVQESVHIHNKAIFDALNESLMKFRPYGLQGEPMPWSNKVRRLQTKVDTSQVDTERLFFMVKQDVMRWSQNCVGCLPTSVFVVRRQIDQGDHQRMITPQIADQFDEEIFQETRERRLAQMLSSEVAEQEHQWLNYEFEESQVKIDLSDMILEHLVEEIVLFMNRS